MSGSQLMATLAAVETFDNYAEIGKATGIRYPHLLTKMCYLKSRGLVRRKNPDAGLSETALFELTEAGKEKLQPEAPEPNEPVVARAIRKRPALATVWSGA
jgi:hypothetical protein